MIYGPTDAKEPIDQGDLIDDCPVLRLRILSANLRQLEDIDADLRRVVVLTQTCDLANAKTVDANVAEVFDAKFLVEKGILKTSDVKGPIRAGRVWGWYFLPADGKIGLSEMIVDFRRLHTVRLDLLRTLVQSGQRRARVLPLYREHLAKHFADTFSRIGLPRPYETM